MSDVSGRWLSVHEEWIISSGGDEVKESYDYGDGPTEQSAYLRLANAEFDILEKKKSSTVDLVYYDRFSPINPETNTRVSTEMTATLKIRTIYGENGASWKILSREGDRLEVYYDSGVLEEDGVEVRRTCWFVFVRKG